MTIEIYPLLPEHVQPAASLFAGQVRHLREQIPALPEISQYPGQVTPFLERILSRGTGLAAIEDGKLVGYLAWLQIDEFRDTARTAGYVPEWAHGCAIGKEDQVYPPLYLKTAAYWAEKQYPIWCMTCLTSNRFLETYLYRNGFGMITHDAVRPIHISGRPLDQGVKIRKCSRQDIDILTGLEAEHRNHYSCAPVLMTAREKETPKSIGEFMAEKDNSYWLAEIDGIPQGLMRFESVSHGAAIIVRSPKTIAITAAFIRPSSRGRGAAYAILQQALSDYEQMGYTTCSVDYETMNPTAYNFWTKYFQPVCFSVLRNPEKFL